MKSLLNPLSKSCQAARRVQYPTIGQHVRGPNPVLESESRWTWNELVFACVVHQQMSRDASNPWYFGFGFSRLWGLDHANYVNPDFFDTVAWVLV